MANAEPDSAINSIDEGPQLRDLFLFKAGNLRFAVPAAEVDGTAEAREPAPLPRAPAAVLGVVHARGRMLTVIDPVALTAGQASRVSPVVSTIISLRGDEQLALAADSVGETITISSADIETSGEDSDSHPNKATAGILRHGGETITVLDLVRLFDAAVQRKERRRRRF